MLVGERTKNFLEKVSVRRINSGKKTWMSVLFDEEILSGTNIGFRMIDGNMVKIFSAY